MSINARGVRQAAYGIVDGKSYLFSSTDEPILRVSTDAYGVAARKSYSFLSEELSVGASTATHGAMAAGS